MWLPNTAGTLTLFKRYCVHIAICMLTKKHLKFLKTNAATFCVVAKIYGFRTSVSYCIAWSSAVMHFDATVVIYSRIHVVTLIYCFGRPFYEGDLLFSMGFSP